MPVTLCIDKTLCLKKQTYMLQEALSCSHLCRRGCCAVSHAFVRWPAVVLSNIRPVDCNASCSVVCTGSCSGAGNTTAKVVLSGDSIPLVDGGISPNRRCFHLSDDSSIQSSPSIKLTYHKHELQSIAITTITSFSIHALTSQLSSLLYSDLYGSMLLPSLSGGPS